MLFLAQFWHQRNQPNYRPYSLRLVELATERQSCAVTVLLEVVPPSLSQGSKTFELPEAYKECFWYFTHRNFAHNSLYFDISKPFFVRLSKG